MSSLIFLITIGTTCALCRQGHIERNKEIRNQSYAAHIYDFSCPKATWMETVAKKEKCSVSQAHVLVVGGNKGYDCIGWLRYFSTSEQKKSWLPSARSWRAASMKHLGKKETKNPCGVCGQCREEYPISVHQLSEEPPTVMCVEPLPANFNMLKSNVEAEPWASSGIQIKQLAVVLSSANLPMAEFPGDAAYGLEGAGVLNLKPGRYKKMIPINTSTVDQLTFGPENPTGVIPTVISVDAEGLDALVLLGAARSLASGGVAYVEFEYHHKHPWDIIQLEWIIGYLDNLQYDCFFAGNNGKTYKVTGCWELRFEFHVMSNLVCASRLVRTPHTCWHDALEAASMDSTDGV